MKPLITALWLAGVLFNTASATPVALEHHGRLVDAQGQPAEGPVALTAAVYTTAEGGTPLHSETVSTLASDGYFSLRLQPIDSSAFDDQLLYLQLNTADGPLLPRTPLRAVPYAVHADLAAGVSPQGALVVGDPGAAACTSEDGGTLRFTDRLEVCLGEDGWRPIGGYPGETEGNPATSCKAIHDDVPALPSGPYWVVDSPGNTFLAWCDMETDGGGWTLGVNIHSDLGPINLYGYRNRTEVWSGANYGVGMSLMQDIDTSTEYRLTCTESSDNTDRVLFLRGLNPAEPIFQAAGTITTTNLQCATNADFTGALSGGSCLTYENGDHTYYGSASFDVSWALYRLGSAYTLRHCANRGNGYFNRGALWYR